MSLINDALKRANESKPPPIKLDDPTAPPLRIVEPPQQPTGPPKWLMFAFPTALLLVCAIAGILIYQGWNGSDEKAPQLGTITASARVTEPDSAPVHPSNNWVAVPAVAGVATNSNNSTGSVAVVSSEPSFPELRLQGVFYRPANPSAMINAKSVFKGDRIDGARVIAIGRDTVTVEWKGQRKVLTIQ